MDPSTINAGELLSFILKKEEAVDKLRFDLLEARKKLRKTNSKRARGEVRDIEYALRIAETYLNNWKASRPSEVLLGASSTATAAASTAISAGKKLQVLHDKHSMEHIRRIVEHADADFIISLTDILDQVKAGHICHESYGVLQPRQSDAREEETSPKTARKFEREGLKTFLKQPLKIPLCYDVFQELSQQDSTIAYMCESVQVSTEDINLPYFNFSIVKRASTIFPLFLHSLDKSRKHQENKGEKFSEANAQEMYNHLVTFLDFVINKVHDRPVITQFSKTPGGAGNRVRDESWNFLMPNRQPDYSMVTSVSALENAEEAMVLLAGELKKESVDLGVKQLLRNVVGPQWISVVTHDTDCFLAVVGTYHQFVILELKPSENGGLAVVHRRVWSRNVKYMGTNVVCACLRAILYNKATQEKPFLVFGAKDIDPPRLFLSSSVALAHRKKTKQLCVSFSKFNILMRLYDGCEPWIEKSVLRRQDTEELYKITSQCSSLIQQMHENDRRHNFGTVLQAHSKRRILKLVPVGVSQAVLVRSSKDIRCMARCILDALQFLHKRGFVHRDIVIHNIIRKDDEYILIDLEAAGKVGADGTAEMPKDETILKSERLEVAARTTLLPPSYRPMFDLNMFLLAALTEAIRDVPANSGKETTEMLNFLRSFQSQLEQTDKSRQGGSKNPVTAEDIEFVPNENIRFFRYKNVTGKKASPAVLRAVAKAKVTGKRRKPDAGPSTQERKRNRK